MPLPDKLLSASDAIVSLFLSISIDIRLCCVVVLLLHPLSYSMSHMCLATNDPCRCIPTFSNFYSTVLELTL